MKQATVKLPSGEYLVQETDNSGNGQSILFPGNWQLLGADPTALTEEEAGEIVESLDQIVVTFYRDYTQKGKVCFTRKQSLDSLAQSLGIEKPFVVLKNVEK